MKESARLLDMNEQPRTDTATRFLFETADIRGETVALGGALEQLLAPHAYAPAVRRLLGEFAAAAVLISNNLKYHGRIVLQARSDGPLSLVMVECTSDSQIRGIARGDISADPESPMALIPAAQLAITIERDSDRRFRSQRYQGIVALDSQSLTEALDNYFLQSEQLHTRFWLAATDSCAAGMMLQQLPAQRHQAAEDRENQWRHACVLADTLTSEELVGLDHVTLLHRLYHEEPLRLFEPKPVVFHCSCSRERSLNALTALSRTELDEIIAEQGGVTMDCEMCGTRYQFTAADLAEVAQDRVLH